MNYRKQIFTIIVSLLYLLIFSSSAFAVGTVTYELLEKAKPDECFIGVGDPGNEWPFDPETQNCAGKLKTNEAYIQGMTQYKGKVFFGTGQNVNCLVTRGYLQENRPEINDDWVCEARANDPMGDFRPPSLYLYTTDNGLAKLILNPAVDPFAEFRRQFTIGIRSGGTHMSGIVFLAGPGTDPVNQIPNVINMFAFNGETGALLGSTSMPEHSNVRKWIYASDGNLYVGVGGAEFGGTGAVLKWTGDPDAILAGDPTTLFDFETVGANLDGEATELTEHDGKLFITTWPAVNLANPFATTPAACGCRLSCL